MRISEAPSAGFPIVGVGASAGGLEACTQLLQHLPADTGMGFVLVQHLDPQHESALTQLLGRVTTMPVREVTDRLRVEPNHIYIIPPNKKMAIVAGVLRLKPRAGGRVPPRSIDFFFESLAQDQRGRAIGVVLSGTATDGTLGLEAIKGGGGITFAQDASAKYDSMPRSAVAAGCVDFELSPENIAGELARIATHPYVAGRAGESGPQSDRAADTGHGDDGPPRPSGGHGTPRSGAKQARAGARQDASAGPEDSGFKKILLLIRNHAGVDFSIYKSATIQRRITRRMVLNQSATIEAYADFLRGNPRELDSLYSDMLISVTSFFRNPDAFELLQHKVFPKLLAQRIDAPVRVWVPGCSAGQEAYSIAMAFAESVGKSPRSRRLQIFATDLNGALLDKARAGFYAKSLAHDLSAERLRRFFVEEEGGYRAKKELRQAVVFARQNVLGDPPFSHVDLISCRNLLIYIEANLQKKILPMFHYSLNPGGILFLGASESVAGFTELFEPIDKKHKIFVKKAGVTPTHLLPMGRVRHPAGKTAGPQHSPAAAPGDPRFEVNAQREAERLLVNQFAPPGVLINDALQILQFRGPTSAFLDPPRGKASFDVLKMAREGLMLPLRAAINKARREGRQVNRGHVGVKHHGDTRTVTLQITPLKNLKERCFLILFLDEQKNPPEHSAAPPRPPRPDQGTTIRAGFKKLESRRIHELEGELAEIHKYVQAMQEENEAASGELQASNEEATSANEELQSINEELETSKEELESTNEELTTVNEEMANRNTELNRLNADLSNFHVSINTPILVLGRDLTLRRFTPLAEKAFNLRAADLGRPLSGIRHDLNLSPEHSRQPHATISEAGSPANLEDLVKEVIDTISLRVREVRNKEGRWFSLRVRPYLTLDNKIDGAVLMLVDIDELKRSERDFGVAREYAEAILRTTRGPLIVLRPDLRVNTANAAFYKSFKASPAETEGRPLWELGNGQWNIPRLRQLLEEILPRDSFFDEFEVVHEFPVLGTRTMLLNARRLDFEDDVPGMILLGIEDVTERLRLDEFMRLSEERIRTSEMRYRRLFEAARDGVLLLDPGTGLITDANPCLTQLLGYSREELIGRKLWQIGLLQDEAASHSAFRQLRQEGFIRYEDLPLNTKTGVRCEVEVVANLYDEDGRKVIQGNIRDITERKQAGEALHQSEERYRSLFALAPMAVFVCDRDAVIQDYNRRAVELWGREPVRGVEQHCGSLKLWLPNGSLLPHARSPLADVLRTGIPAPNVEVLIERPDGSRLPVLGNFAALRDAAGEITGAIVSFVDITAHRQAAVDLERARDEALDASRAKDEFLAALSHELRTPLNPVLLLASDAVENLDLPDHVRADFETIRNNIGLEARLIDDLLDLTRISHGKLNLEAQPCEVHAELRSAIAVVGCDIDEKRLRLAVNLAADRTLVLGDPVRLQQVFWNVLRNAVHFTPREGAIAVDSRTDPDSDELVVTISDSGIGIAPGDLGRIFDTFAQGDTGPGAGRRSGGLGLGLAISRKMVELHAGSIQATSPGRGGGSTFVIRLPLLPKDGPDSAVSDPSASPAKAAGLSSVPNPPAPSSSARSSSRGRVLIVDDHAPTRTALQRLLERRNFEVFTARCVADALTDADQHHIDYLISDIGLPDGDGHSLMSQLRATRPALQGIALSGYGTEDDVSKSHAAGFGIHLTKPVTIGTLDRALGALLPPDRAWREMPR